MGNPIPQTHQATSAFFDQKPQEVDFEDQIRTVKYSAPTAPTTHSVLRDEESVAFGLLRRLQVLVLVFLSCALRKLGQRPLNNRKRELFPNS